MLPVVWTLFAVLAVGGFLVIAAYWLDVQGAAGPQRPGPDRLVAGAAGLPALDPRLCLRRRAGMAAVPACRQPGAGVGPGPLLRLRLRGLQVGRSRRNASHDTASTSATTPSSASAGSGSPACSGSLSAAVGAVNGKGASAPASSGMLPEQRPVLCTAPSKVVKTSQRSSIPKLIPQEAPSPPARTSTTDATSPFAT